MDVAGKLYPTGRIGTTNYILTPENIVNDMINMLPDDFWTPDVKVLDIFSKSGRFLMAAYKKLFNSPYLADMDIAKRKRHILSEQLYGITDDFTCLLISERMLYGYAQYGKKNIRMVDNMQTIIKDSKKFVGVVEGNFENMKFDLVIGNPPYQKESERGTQGAVSIYTDFMQAADELSSRFSSLLVPARWLSNAGSRGIHINWVKEQLKSNQYTKISILNSKEVFQNVEIKGGVMYYLKDHSYSGKCLVNKELRYLDDAGVGKFIANAIESGIIRKIHENSKVFMNTIVSSYSPFGLQSNVICKTSGSVRLYRTGGQIENIDESEIPKGHDILAMYKVFVPLSYGDGRKGEILNNIKIARPMEACTSTYVAIYPTMEEYIAENVAKYLHTKLFNMLIGEVKVTQSASKEVYQLVPVQDFTYASDIDWSQSVTDIDRQLYRKYKLTNDEIAYIEKTFRTIKQ